LVFSLISPIYASTRGEPLLLAGRFVHLNTMSFFFFFSTSPNLRASSAAVFGSLRGDSTSNFLGTLFPPKGPSNTPSFFSFLFFDRPLCRWTPCPPFSQVRSEILVAARRARRRRRLPHFFSPGFFFGRLGATRGTCWFPPIRSPSRKLWLARRPDFKAKTGSPTKRATPRRESGTSRGVERFQEDNARTPQRHRKGAFCF